MYLTKLKTIYLHMKMTCFQRVSTPNKHIYMPQISENTNNVDT